MATERISGWRRGTLWKSTLERGGREREKTCDADKGRYGGRVGGSSKDGSSLINQTKSRLCIPWLLFSLSPALCFVLFKRIGWHQCYVRLSSRSSSSDIDWKKEGEIWSLFRKNCTFFPLKLRQETQAISATDLKFGGPCSFF